MAASRYDLGDAELPSDHQLYDGVPFRTPSKEEMHSYSLAETTLATLKVPSLYDRNDPHARLFIAFFDGTGNDAYADKMHATNVFRVYDQVDESKHPRVHAEYIAGPGTRGGSFERAVDNAIGATSPAIVADMHVALADQVEKWRREDPRATISVGTVGFSRGAIQSAVFVREVHERGITYGGADETGPVMYRIEPGETPMGVILLDPVSTGELRNYDRRLPDSVVTGLQITALSERRAKFPVDHIIPPGLSADGRFLGVQVAGAHSDIGGSYIRHGLGVRNANMMIDVLNAWDSSRALATKYPVPTSPGMTVIHRSQYGHPLFVFDRRIDRVLPPGYRVDLVPPLPNGVSEVSTGSRSPVAKRYGGMPSIPVTVDPLPGADEGKAFRLASLPPKDEATRAHQLRWRTAGRAFGGAVTFAHGVGALRELSARQDEKNAFAADQTVLDFGVTVGSGWAGARAGAGLGLALGIESGPGAFVTAMAGAAVGAVAANKVHEVVRDYRVYSQDDEQGRTWHFDRARPEAGWTRTQTRVDAQRYDARALPLERITGTADARTADLLDYKSKGAGVAMSLAERAPPTDPYVQEPVGEARHPDVGPWVKDLAAGAWTRTVVTGHLEHGLKISHRETAVPERAALLDRQADAVIAANVARSPRLHALQYATEYEERGWSRHGPMEASARPILDAIKRGDGTWKGLDGDEYTHRADGAWVRESWFGDAEASAPVATELERRRSAVLREEAMPHPVVGERVPLAPTRDIPNAPTPLHDPVAPVAPFAHPDLANLWTALQAGDMKAISAACHRIDASPEVQAMHQAADRMVAAQREEQARLASEAQRSNEFTLWPAIDTPRRDVGAQHAR